jgi:hypothetical protein
LARVHFKDRIAAELPTKKPYVCPFEGCDEKQYPDWQVTEKDILQYPLLKNEMMK